MKLKKLPAEIEDTKRHCPHCNRKLVYVVWGFPLFELIDFEKSEEVYLGGCVPNGAAVYYCFSCQDQFYDNLSKFQTK